MVKEIRLHVEVQQVNEFSPQESEYVVASWRDRDRSFIFRVSGNLPRRPKWTLRDRKISQFSRINRLVMYTLRPRIFCLLDKYRARSTDHDPRRRSYIEFALFPPAAIEEHVVRCSWIPSSSDLHRRLPTEEDARFIGQDLEIRMTRWRF